MATMSRTLDDISAEALQLVGASRAALAKKLLESLPDPSPHETLDSWVVEAARRYEDLVAGKSTAIPSEDLLRKLESRHTR
jgi:putative addiction module component (TIGR02574 family)